MTDYCDVNVLVGKTLSNIDGGVDSSEISFTTTDGEVYRMFHYQDCCESVYVYDIVGDMEDLVGSELPKNLQENLLLTSTRQNMSP